jgi:integrase
MLFATAIGGRPNGEEQDQTETFTQILKLPDLEQSKSAVLNSLTSPCSQRTYDHAIREFIEWYCSEARLAFSKTVVTRYRISLEPRHYGSTTMNLRLAAVRRLAYEAADCGLLRADLAAGIRRAELAALRVEDIQQREKHWVLAQLTTSDIPIFRKVGPPSSASGWNHRKL